MPSFKENVLAAVTSNTVAKLGPTRRLVSSRSRFGVMVALNTARR